jgi:predicted nucleic-acid-binding Zn-ribbon protein
MWNIIKKRDMKSKSVEQFNITVTGGKLKDITKVENVFRNYFKTITEKNEKFDKYRKEMLFQL